ncbi:reverse transcriptase domain-containing protein [Tanacetum coccineum]
MVIETADNTKCTSKEIVRNLLVKIDKFIFPVDFVILDMVEDFRMPILLGRLLLATAHAKVDIVRKLISLEVGNEKFNGKSKDGDDLEGIIDYLEPASYDGFIDLDDEAYKERKCKLLGMTYRKPPPILVEKVEVTRYTVGPGENYTKVIVLGIDEIPRSRDNFSTVRARLIEEMKANGSARGET